LGRQQQGHAETTGARPRRRACSHPAFQKGFPLARTSGSTPIPRELSPISYPNPDGLSRRSSDRLFFGATTDDAASSGRSARFWEGDGCEERSLYYQLTIFKPAIFRFLIAARDQRHAKRFGVRGYHDATCSGTPSGAFGGGVDPGVSLNRLSIPYMYIYPLQKGAYCRHDGRSVLAKARAIKLLCHGDARNRNGFGAGSTKPRYGLALSPHQAQCNLSIEQKLGHACASLAGREYRPSADRAR
jgi:hypothetical protein